MKAADSGMPQNCIKTKCDSVIFLHDNKIMKSRGCNTTCDYHTKKKFQIEKQEILALQYFTCTQYISTTE